MIKRFKLFEEIKRKSPAGFDIIDTFSSPGKNFNSAESKILKNEDFVVNGNIAVCEEKSSRYTLKKIQIGEYSTIYDLTVEDLRKNKTYNRKFKSDIFNRIKVLDALMNICAKFHEETILSNHKDKDPFGEEIWERLITKFSLFEDSQEDIEKAHNDIDPFHEENWNKDEEKKII